MKDVSTPLTITSIAYGGKGVARSDGKVWFVSDCLPGDKVMARPVTIRARFVEAEVDSWLEQSPLRQSSPCPVSVACGGCQWLSAPYAQQLMWKKSFVESALQRIGKVSRGQEITITGSPRDLHYRNRILLRAYGTGDGLDVGYFRAKSRDLVRISGCHIADPLLNKMIESLSQIAANKGSKWRLECQVLGIARDQIAVTVYPGEKNTAGSRELVANLAALSFVAWSGQVFDLPDAPLLLLEEDAGLKFHTLPGQFQQINSDLNRILRTKVRDLAAAYRPARILDLFCGSGNLSLVLAAPDRYVEAVEANKKAIEVGRKNAQINNLRIKFIADDANTHLRNRAEANETFDVVVLDPPRQGMIAGLDALIQIKAQAIIYVSCDPNTLARDIGVLTKSDAYQLVHVEALDFFPNTYHVETVAVLERTDRTGVRRD